MKFLVYFLMLSYFAVAQDLSDGYIANDLQPRPQQSLTQPDYLEAVIDPSFPSTNIRRISEVSGTQMRRVPMYSTIQAWNADESFLILYGNGEHYLLNGTDYSVIRPLSDIVPDDIETIFWHFEEPSILFYLEDSTKDFIRYNVIDQSKEVIVNLISISNCGSSVSMGNDVQMMSWDSDVFSFRCANDTAYYYRISTETLTQFNIDNLNYVAPMPFPSGERFYHNGAVYDDNGQLLGTLNVDKAGEHSCLGRLSNGDDALFAIAFEEGPNGNCQGTIVAHNAITQNCFSVTPPQGYGYPQSGTHISALAHKNDEGGWIAASMIGYDRDGQELLDQELLIAKVNEDNADVYRVAHHRSDEDEFNYFGEPHVTISPKGTRLLFGSDWSDDEDGTSLNAYVAELKAYTNVLSLDDASVQQTIEIYPNPVSDFFDISGNNIVNSYTIHSLSGSIVSQGMLKTNRKVDIRQLPQGIFFVTIRTNTGSVTKKLIKK